MQDRVLMGEALSEVIGIAGESTQAGVEIERDDALTFQLELPSDGYPEGLVEQLNADFDGVAEAQPLFQAVDTTDETTFVELVFPGVDEQLAEPVAFQAAYELAQMYGLVSAQPDLPTAYYLQPSETPPPEAAGESAMVRGLCEVTDVPAPPDNHWAVKLIKADRAILYSNRLGRVEGGAGILVAQPDTGVRPHSELNEAIVAGEGWDVLRGQAGARDPMARGNPGHGTATASCVASRNEGLVLGSAPAATVYPIRCIKAVIVVMKTGPVAKAIEHAVQAGAQVITMSLGGAPSRAVRVAIRRATAKNVIVMAAAGNCVKTVVWPARYPECISVAGCNSQLKPWRGSCRGRRVDITAPGEMVYHASAKGPPDVKDGQGTSFAVALTAGAAAQWLAHHGTAEVAREADDRGVTVQELFRAALKKTAERHPGLPAADFGPGLLDVEALLKLDLKQIPGASGVKSEDYDDRVEPELGDLFREFGGADIESVGLNWRLYSAELGDLALRRSVRATALRESLSETAPAASSGEIQTAAEQTGDDAMKRWVGA